MMFEHRHSCGSIDQSKEKPAELPRRVNLWAADDRYCCPRSLDTAPAAVGTVPGEALKAMRLLPKDKTLPPLAFTPCDVLNWIFELATVMVPPPLVCRPLAL
jgi:hypothetical protein